MDIEKALKELTKKKALWKEILRIDSLSDEEYEEEFGPSYDILVSSEDTDEIPEGCKACGGPWPDCETSCSLFDD